ncbi:hypothetical protein ABW22_12335 [Thiobacillus denitrificans]|uniref:Uncharacterized protein n=1 Tax=Thiobacillus denitrificans TaxID=36861 RepID=A0A119CUY7_THIDE|nr:hypothetical protein ABW22_12335 [Thiobacillus denitrificans]
MLRVVITLNGQDFYQPLFSDGLLRCTDVIQDRAVQIALPFLQAGRANDKPRFVNIRVGESTVWRAKNL